MLLTRPPLSYNPCIATDHVTPFDLHVLGAPPAFVLSQDQTLHRCIKSPKASNQMKFVQADSEHLAFASFWNYLLD